MDAVARVRALERRLARLGLDAPPPPLPDLLSVAHGLLDARHGVGAGQGRRGGNPGLPVKKGAKRE